jgi:hypothetical protein
MKLLVHICCAPDAVYFLKRLREDYPQASIVGFFYDPNIHPYEEYRLRYIETERTCRELGIELYEGEYDLEGWLSSVRGYEEEPERGRRCAICFDYRLLRSLEFAKKVGATHLTTTLLMSPKKEFNMLKESGQKVCENTGIEFLALDYRKGGGTQEMFRLSRELELYHQDYCGCIYGLFKQKKGEVFWDLVSFGGRPPGSKEEMLFIKEVRLYAETELGLSCREWDFDFLNWRVLQGKLEVKGQVVPSFVRPYSASVRGLLKADPVEKAGNVIYYNKGGLRIFLKERLEDEPLEDFDGICSPAFLVSKEYEEVLTKERVSVSLQTHMEPGRSSVLLMGSLQAKDIYAIPADTLQDSRGLSLEALKELLSSSLEEVLRGERAYLLCGAYSLGRTGIKYFEQRTGRRVKALLCSQTP